MSGSKDVSLTIFIASVSGGESLTSFVNSFFHLSGPTSFRFAFDVAEKNGRFGRIQCQRSKANKSRGKRRVFFFRKAVRVGVKSKVISASFLEGGRSLGRKIGERETVSRFVW